MIFVIDNVPSGIDNFYVGDLVLLVVGLELPQISLIEYWLDWLAHWILFLLRWCQEDLSLFLYIKWCTVWLLFIKKIGIFDEVGAVFNLRWGMAMSYNTWVAQRSTGVHMFFFLLPRMIFISNNSSIIFLRFNISSHIISWTGCNLSVRHVGNWSISSLIDKGILVPTNFALVKHVAMGTSIIVASRGLDNILRM